MAEFQLFGMEIKAVCALAVEGVAQNGAIHAVGVGGMYAELVGATRLWPICDAGAEVAFLSDDMYGVT